MSFTRFKECLRDGFKDPDMASKLYKGGGGTTTQNNDPWVGAQPFLKDFMQQGQTLSRNPTKYYPGKTVAGFDPATNGAFGQMMQMSSDPMSGANLASNQINDTIQGEYLPSGERFNAITAPVMDAVNSQFQSGGRYGSAYHQQGLEKGMMEAMQPYWDSERGRMMSASALAPTADMARVNPMLQVGQARQGMNQANIDANVARFNFRQEEPWQRLQRYASLVSPGAGMGGSSTMTQPGGSKLAGAAGGALGGYAAASMIPALGPYGIPLAVAGGLLGAFG